MHHCIVKLRRWLWQQCSTAIHSEMTIVYKQIASIHLLQLPMASTAAAKRTLRPRNPNVRKSYKNTCGAPAPRASLESLQQDDEVQPKATTTKKSTKGKKTVKPKPIHDDGKLIYTITGDRLPSGAVSGFASLLFIFPITSNKLVVQWLPRWGRGHYLHNLQNEFNLQSLHRL